MESLEVDLDAVKVELVETEDTSCIFNAAETMYVKMEDLTSIKFSGELM